MNACLFWCTVNFKKKADTSFKNCIDELAILIQSNLWNNHPYKTTTRLRRPMLSFPKPIPIQLLLYKTTTCLMWPVTTVIVPQMKKSLSKTATAKLYLAKKMEAMQKKKIAKCLSDYIFTLLLL